jgi:hypothetical protein
MGWRVSAASLTQKEETHPLAPPCEKQGGELSGWSRKIPPGWLRRPLPPR